MSRDLPDVDDLARQVLDGVIDYAAGQSNHISPDQPEQLTDLLPWVVARRISGAALTLRLADRPVLLVDCFAASRRQASDLAADCGTRLYRAWRAQTRYPAGVVNRFREIDGPAQTPSGIPGVWRFLATYGLTTRP